MLLFINVFCNVKKIKMRVSEIVRPRRFRWLQNM